jgi:hypothetical protein
VGAYEINLVGKIEDSKSSLIAQMVKSRIILTVERV